MNILILHDAPGGRADEQDALVQAESVGAALAELGHHHRPVACTLDLAATARHVRSSDVDVVFNLVESLGGHGRLIHVVPYLLDAMGVAYSGAPADAVHATSNKLIGKRMMRNAGIPTPRSWTPSDSEVPFSPADRIIIKSVWEHASIGLSNDSVLSAPRSDMQRFLMEELERRVGDLGGPERGGRSDGFVEEYIDGREFNLSLIAGDDGRPMLLPPAEILFEGFAPDRPRIVNYQAKWDANSYEYHHTPRSFDTLAVPSQAELKAELGGLAMRCWHLFGLRGYARVDFRVDLDGRPWVLEVNTNPCLSPDAGFAGALKQAGISFPRCVEMILNDALGQA